MTPKILLDDEIDATTFADVVRGLGDIPLNRIRWRPYPGTATEADAIALAERNHKPTCELVDGILVEKAVGLRESIMAMVIGQHLLNFVQPRRLGFVAGEGGLMRLIPGLMRAPDVSFAFWSSLPTPGAANVAVGDFAPDLAIEVISRSNTKKEIARKRREYLAHGCKLVWIIDPKKATAEVYDDPARPNRKTPVPKDGVLDGGAVLPGFSLSLAELFDSAEPPTT